MTPTVRLDAVLRAVAEVRQGASDQWRGCCDELARRLLLEHVPQGTRIALRGEDDQDHPHVSQDLRTALWDGYRRACEGGRD